MSATPEATTWSATHFVVRVTKLSISLAYFICRSLIHAFGNARPVARCVVLYYHTVPAQYRSRFEWQMRTLARSAQVLDLNLLENIPRGTTCVAITFDDGLQSFAENALPILQSLNLPSVLFVVTGGLGRAPGWAAGYFTSDERLMTAKQLATLPASVTIGSHTSSHANLSCLSSAASLREIAGSRHTLEALLQRPVTLFSFPFGSFDEPLTEQCREAGYRHVFTTQPVSVMVGSAPFVIGRVAADPWDWRIEFHLKIRGAYCWQLRPRREQPRRQIFATPVAESAPISQVGRTV